MLDKLIGNEVLRDGTTKINATIDEVNRINVEGVEGVEEALNTATSAKEDVDIIKIKIERNEEEALLKADSILGTTQQMEFISGQIAKIYHRDAVGNALREDTFDYATNLIVETRILLTGAKIVYHYRLDDFSTQILSKASKLYKNELVYSRATWTEWQNKGTAVVDNGFLKADNLDVDIYPFLPTTIKPNTRYGILFHVRENTRTSNAVIVSGSGGAYPFPNPISISAGAVGSFKSTQTTNSFTTSADFRSAVTKNTGNITYGDMRVIELPAGSKIERDFTILSAELLHKMYPWEVL